ncbi:MAG: hypothetical protein HQ465_18905 [Rhodospirillales bacterium]|nr:hypothetical protein [Rhodospirillales bacterium]
MHEDFLPGVPAAHILARLAKAGGDEIDSGKFANPESSAALACNTFGWFVDRPDELPPLPGMKPHVATSLVDVEYCPRFPWRGGRHPWLDAIVETGDQLVGVESKRFEPYRDSKKPNFSTAYSRPVWGMEMKPYEAMRDALTSGQQTFDFLDAAQLVKHAFGLVTDGRRKGKAPVLVYLFAEPASLKGSPIPEASFGRHREEIQRFAAAVREAEVSFQSISYREWLATWPFSPSPVGDHARAVIERFHP